MQKISLDDQLSYVQDQIVMINQRYNEMIQINAEYLNDNSQEMDVEESVRLFIQCLEELKFQYDKIFKQLAEQDQKYNKIPPLQLETFTKYCKKQENLYQVIFFKLINLTKKSESNRE